MDIAVFQHIWCTNHWREIVKEQHDLIASSKLGDVATVYMGVIGSADDAAELAAMTGGRFRFGIVRHREDPSEFEFPTLELVRSHAALVGGVSLYIHTKGVSATDPAEKDGKAWWRGVMQRELIENWGSCIDRLMEGFDSVGCDFKFQDKPLHYYAGNFWWARNDFLAGTEACYRGSRYDAELWLHSFSPRDFRIPIPQSL